MREPETPRRPSEGQTTGAFARLLVSIGTVNISLAAGGALAILIGFLIWIFFHEMRPFSYVVMALGGVALLVAFLVSYQQMLPVLTGRRSRFGANTLIMSLIFFGIAMLVNYFVFDVGGNWRVDTTAAKQFSLAPRTVDLLKNLDTPIQAVAFFRESDPEQAATASQVDDLLHEFDRRSGNFSYRFVDPDADPITAKEYAVSRYQAVIFENLNDGKRQTVATPPVFEERFVTALLLTSGQEQKRVYFLTGHGERDTLDVESDDGYWQAYNGLMHDNYLPLTLNLLDQQQVPDDAAAVIWAGPKKDFVEGEERALEEFLLKGGRMLLLLDPATPPAIRTFVENWGVLVPEGRIIDLASSVGGDPKIPLLERGQYTNLVPEFSDVLDVTFFPEVSALVPARETPEEMPNIEYLPIGATSSNSWLVRDPAQDRPLAGDLPGPWAVAVAVNAWAPLALLPGTSPTYEQASLVVIGDSDFAANRYFYAFSNSDLFLDSVNWLTEDYSLIQIRPKPLSFRELVLTTRERDFFRYSTWFLLPLTMLGLAGIVWWRRR